MWCRKALACTSTEFLRLAAHRDLVHAAARMLRLAVHGAEGAEVVLADQRLRGAVHRAGVESAGAPSAATAAAARAARRD
jgi:hypothetical protein